MNSFWVHDRMLAPSVPVRVRANGRSDKGSVQIEWKRLGNSPSVNTRTRSNVVESEYEWLVDCGIIEAFADQLACYEMGKM